MTLGTILVILLILLILWLMGKIWRAADAVASLECGSRQRLRADGRCGIRQGRVLMGMGSFAQCFLMRDIFVPSMLRLAMSPC